MADAALSGDDPRLLDELGDLLFQVHFLALLLEERGAGDLAAVADHCARKLVRRHPHVFGAGQADDAAAVLRHWDAAKRAEEREGGASPPPGNLPATIYARKVQRRVAAAAGVAEPDAGAALARLVESARAVAGEGSATGAAADDAGESLGELLYAAVAAGRELGVDAELALRRAADRRLERLAAAPARAGTP